MFQVSSDKIQEKVLRFSVYDVDRRRIRHSLGHVLVPLKDMDVTKGDVIWKDLEPHSQVKRNHYPFNCCLKINIISINKV